MLGMFGDIVFEVSDEKMMTFEGFTREAASTYQNHALIGQKPRTEFIAPGLDTISFTVLLNARCGVKPREEMNKWIEYCRSGDAFPLMIGGSALGVDLWVVTSVSQHWDTIFNKGELVSGKVDVSLQEYVSSMWTVSNYRAGLSKLATQSDVAKISDNAVNDLAIGAGGGYNGSGYASISSTDLSYFDPDVGEFVYANDGIKIVGESGARDLMTNNSYCIEPREL